MDERDRCIVDLIRQRDKLVAALRLFLEDSKELLSEYEERYKGYRPHLIEDKRETVLIAEAALQDIEDNKWTFDKYS